MQLFEPSNNRYYDEPRKAQSVKVEQLQTCILELLHVDADLEKKHFVAKTEMAQDAKRHCDAVQKMHQYEANIPQLEIATQQFQKNLIKAINC